MAVVADGEEELAAETLGLVIVTPMRVGGQKRVFLAEDTDSTKVVLKVVVLPDQEDEPDGFIQVLIRARREVELLAGIDSCHVVAVRSELISLEQKGSPKILAWVEEFLSGSDLKDLLPPSVAPWDWPSTKGMIVGVARGLNELHVRNVVHRDLSPANIRKRANGTWTILDPGWARHLAEVSITGVYQPGTPGYLTPEHAPNGKPGTASDIFGLGILAWHALTGTPPISSSTPLAECLQYLTRNQIPSIREFRNDLPEVPKNPAAKTVLSEVRENGGLALFDATTHGFLPGIDKFDFYDGWDLWKGAKGKVETDAEAAEHVRRVFVHQDLLGTQHLVPTKTLTVASGSGVDAAMRLSSAGHASDPKFWQSLAGTRSFWSSAEALDQLVGELTHLRAPTWVLTFVRDRGIYPPDQTDVDAESGMLRTVASLAIRSKVIIAHADLAGFSAIAAGASHLGTGWDATQRVFSAESLTERPPGGKYIKYLTYEQLLGRTRIDQYEALQRVDPARAIAWIGTGGPAATVEPREGHFRVLGTHVTKIKGGKNIADRVDILRSLYSRASGRWTSFNRKAPAILDPGEGAKWYAAAVAALEAFADGEGL